VGRTDQQDALNMKWIADSRTDDDLVLQAVAGSSSAFEVLYDRHARAVARTLTSFAGPDRALLDDLVQEVFLRVVEHLDSYVPKRPFPHWLHTIALNVGRNHARRPKIVVLADSETLADIPVPDAGDMLDSVTLMHFVSQLPEPMRQVIALRVGPELAYCEIGAILGIPEGTARSRMHNAVQLLRARCANPENETNVQE
jgi:RNA polymerase sigma-70 factor (ECF subfamily)